MAYEGRKDIPRIYQVYNPCAVFKGKKWLSGELVYPGQDNNQPKEDRAIHFVGHNYGINAAGKTLIGFQKYRGLNTIEALITTYAPPFENLTTKYIKLVSQRLKVLPNAPIKVEDEKTLGALIRAIIMVECGPTPPKDLPSNWVEEPEIDQGVRMALGKARMLSPITDAEAASMMPPP
jgi:hypothetical protein